MLNLDAPTAHILYSKFSMLASAFTLAKSRKPKSQEAYDMMAPRLTCLQMCRQRLGLHSGSPTAPVHQLLTKGSEYRGNCAHN